MKLFLKIALLVVGLCLVSEVNSGTQFFFNLGKTQAITMANGAWGSLDKSCRDVSEFTEIIRDSIQRIVESRNQQERKNEDFINGYKAGLERVLREVRGQCPSSRKAINKVAKEGGIIIGEPKAPPRRRSTRLKEEPPKSPFFLGKNIGSATAMSIWHSLEQDCRRLRKLSSLIEVDYDKAKRKYVKEVGEKDIDQFIKGHKKGMDSVLLDVEAGCSGN